MTPGRTRMTAGQRREIVLQAALTEFATRGLNGTSAQDIARRAGISHPYLFRLFPTKKALFLAVVRRCFQQTCRVLATAAAGHGRAGSTLLQRLALVDVRTDREVWMIYSSFMRTLGPGLIWSYGPEAAAIWVGTTGGGPDIPGSPQMPSLTWEEFARDLRLARRWCDHILIHSLEGCVWQGFLGRLRSFDWADGITSPGGARAASGFRRCLRAALRASAHPWVMLGTATACYCLIRLRVWPRKAGI